jgi:SAM-dependent methyltransferase
MYKGDLAYIQHAGFSDFAARIGPGVLSEMRQAGINTGRVVDLGCGNGTWLGTLIDSGYAAHGIDQSKDLVKYAARVAPKATVRVGSIYKTPFPRCDAMTALGEVFCYWSKESGSLQSLRRLLHRAHAALRPGGVLIFDVLVVGRSMHYETWRAGRTWAVLARVSEERRQHRLIREILTFRRTARGYRRGEERHVLRVFTRRAVVGELRRAGFRVSARSRYGRVLLPFRRVGFIARKPGAVFAPAVRTSLRLSRMGGHQRRST